ncbi:MAG: polysaccharide biosynthesis protein [Paludibacteraceae bacterium]|nr:polysaccharide biosynthesis protein [Paludibacteraceae bacterium]
MRHYLTSSDIFSHIPDLKYLPRWGVLLMDLLLCSIAFFAAILVGDSLFDYHLWNVALSIWEQAFVLLVIQTGTFWLYHTYSGIIRFSTFVDIIKVLFSILTTSIVTLLINTVSRHLWNQQLFLNTSLLIYIGTAFILLFCFRVGVKTIYDDMVTRGSKRKRVLIYGTKAAGQAIAQMLLSSGPNSNYVPVGFITDGNDMKQYFIQGLRVYLMNDHIAETMDQLGVHDVIVSPLKMKEINPATDLEVFLQHNIHILTTPSFTTWDKAADMHNRIGRIENIQIEDLLERPTIQINTDNVANILANQVVMITGAAGSIGSELVRQVLNYNPSLVVLFEQAESPLHDLYLDLKNVYPKANIMPVIGDVRNREKLENVFSEYHPRVVFHAAAYKHVPLMEEFPNEAILANVLGTKNMADLSVKYGVARFVMISTDKAVNPTNVMGASKRIAEIYVQSLFRKLEKENANCTKFITTRFGNVLGSNGSVIPYFKKQIAAGGPVTVTHPDIIRFFMTIPEACTLVLEAATLGNGGEIFVFDMGKPVRILDLARNMIRLAGYQPDKDISITFTGLRPGEKLYEEVLNQKETTLPTSNDKIMIARVRETDFDVMQHNVDTLLSLANQNNAMKVVKQMKQIVPEFKSKNSIYEQLD